MWLGCNSSVNNFYKTAVKRQLSDKSKTSQNRACIFTSNCLQKTMSFLFYHVFLKSRNLFKTKNVDEKKRVVMLSVFNGLSAAAYWPVGTAYCSTHTVKTKQNPLTFNKYFCTQCYIHVLYIGTQEWVWIVASYFFAENTKLCLCYCSQMHGGCEEILFYKK